MAPPDAPAGAPHDPSAVALALAARLDPKIIGTGSLASLRRLDPRGALAEPALQRLLAREVPDHWLHGQGMRDWALVVHLLALGAPAQHRGGQRLGAALHAAGYSESRLLRLLEADRDGLATLLPRACRFLVAKGERLNPPELARLVRAASGAGDNPEAIEQVRTDIARAYYRAERDAA